MSTIHFCSENCSSAGKSQWISSNHAMLTIKSPSLPILMLSLKKVVRVDVCSLFSSTKASNILANRQIMSHKLCWLLDMFPFISCRDFHKNLLLWSQTVWLYDCLWTCDQGSQRVVLLRLFRVHIKWSTMSKRLNNQTFIKEVFFLLGSSVIL